MRRLLRRVERRRLLSAMIAIALCFSAMLGMLVTSSSDRTDTAARESPDGDSSIPVRALALASHDPILIDGNDGFAGPNASTGVTRGSGTESDPFMIEGWDINASTAQGIEIQSADAHFIIRNCYVHDGDSLGHTYDGIFLLNCVNGTLEENNCSNNYVGIWLAYSSNNTIINNNCSSNGYIGMFFHWSSNNTLTNNTCSSNNEWAIWLQSSSGNTLSNNTCSSNSDGIHLYSSGNNTVRNNTCSSNNNHGMFLESLSNNNTICNNICSSNNASGIFLSSSCNNSLNLNTCSNSNYGIFLSWSSNNAMTNNTCSSNSYDGMYLVYSNDNTLCNNTCSSNPGYGIFLIDSGSNSLSNNVFWWNGQYGLSVWSAASSNNRIWNNTFCHNNGAIDTYDASHIQAYDDGTSNWWNSTEGHGNYWSDWTTPDVSPADGIVDQPYNISGSASAKDHYPLTTIPTGPIPEFGMMPVVVMAFLAAISLIIGARRRKAQ